MECLPNRYLCNELSRFLFTVLVILVLSLASFPRVSLSTTATQSSALLKWKSTLHYPAPSTLSSWKLIPSSPLNLSDNSPCTWAGIACDDSRSIIRINLTDLGLSGTLGDLSFFSFPKLVSLDLSVNSLHGNIPPQLATLKLLRILDLSGNKLTGPIPASLINLDNLITLNLAGNELTGSIPRELGTLKSLRLLFLDSNNLTGSIPTSIGNWSSLLELDLGYNKLSGSVPEEIGKLNSLTGLYVCGNELTGSIPTSIGNMSSLLSLQIADNILSGSIPKEMAMLKSLNTLSLSMNEFTGSIPRFIGNFSNLLYSYLYRNKFSGHIPEEIGMLSNLLNLDLSTNNLSGSIPTSVRNLANLNILYLYYNNLSGPVPSCIGNISSLVELNLAVNRLSGYIPREIGKLKNLNNLSLFMNKFTGSVPLEMNNLTSLKILLLGVNMLTGHLPQNVCQSGVLEKFTASENNFTGPIPFRNCTSLIRVRLEKNHLVGNISEDFGVYPNLDYMDLSYNNLNGGLSKKWRQCRKLTSLRISNNKISGSIPSELGELDQMRVLDISSNHLVHTIPKELGRLTSLLTLELHCNKLSGSVPSELGMLTNLEHLNLASNELSDFIPRQLKGCMKLLYLNLSRNRFIQRIPAEIGDFKFLQNLDVSHNWISGEIPRELGELLVLESLNLSHNQLSGSVPSNFDEMSSLIFVDVSHNQLEGRIPNNKAFQKAPIEAFEENKGLCGNNNATALKLCPLEPDCNKGTKIRISIVMIPISVAVFLLFVTFGLFVVICTKKQTKNPPKEPYKSDFFEIWSHDGKMMHHDIVRATEEFGLKHCIGVGNSGSVYKAELPTGQVVAVKKLHSFEESEATNLQKSFSREIRSLAQIRHRNIVKLLGFCWHVHYSYLIYEYLEGGSLERILSTDELAMNLGWIERVNILKGVADALAYMHHDCAPPIIHRDISSKNILLDLDYEARVSDFGTARILEMHSSICTSFAGTFGYTAPELAHSVRLSEKCDVYSFGVLILEVIMGRHPSDLLLNLSSETCRQISLKDALLDPRLYPPENRVAQEVITATRLAVSCLRAGPQSRPTMQQVSQELSICRMQPSFTSLQMITLGQLLDRFLIF